jgi:hypothetical protein
MIWQNHETLIRCNSETENTIQSVIRELKTLLPSELIPHNKAGAGRGTGQKSDPDILDSQILLLLMLGYPPADVRGYLLKKMKQTLNSTIKNLPEGIHTKPDFYPGTLTDNPAEKSPGKINIRDIELLLAISESLLLYNLFTEDKEYLLSGGFDHQLILSRVWASWLRNMPFLDAIKAETTDFQQVIETAVRILQMTLGNITYLKSENSWMYEDYRENHRFSEIKETAAWKEIIRNNDFSATDSWASLMIRMKMDSSRPDGKSHFPVFFTDTASGVINYHNTQLKDLAYLWNSTLINCLGLSLKNRLPVLQPVLPEGWSSFCFQFHLRNTIMEVEADRQKYIIHNRTANKVNIILNNRSREIPGNGSLSGNF